MMKISDGKGQGDAPRFPWVAFLLPFAIYMVLGLFEPRPEGDATEESRVATSTTRDSGSRDGFTWRLPERHYPAWYTLRIAGTSLAIFFCLGTWRGHPLRTPWLGAVVGLLGGVLWIGICSLEWEARFLGSVGWSSLQDLGARAAYDPGSELADQPTWKWTFLIIRFYGLVVVVPLIEEFFLRGLVLRYVANPRWWELSVDELGVSAYVVSMLYGAASHPAEMLAAILWFGLVTWLMIRTGSIWCCVIAHATTNLLLGGYVVATGNWHLW